MKDCIEKFHDWKDNLTEESYKEYTEYQWKDLHDHETEDVRGRQLYVNKQKAEEVLNHPINRGGDH
jgi:hypothetical protein